MKLSSFPLIRFLACAIACVIAPLALQAQTSLPSGTVGASYSFQIATNPPAASGSVFSATGLAPGLAINASSGLITGTPTTAGTFDGTVSVTSGGNTNNYAVRLTINAAAGASAITSSTSASGTVGAAFSYTVTASPAATSFNIGPLPPGLSGNTTTGAITGTPTATGTYTVTVSANNSSGATGAPKVLTITIGAAASAPVISSAATVSGQPGTAFSYTITATNSPTSFAAAPLPLGLSLNSATGVISGTPTLGGITDVALTATNASGTSSVATLKITIGTLPVLATTTASGTVGAAFSLTLSANPAATSFNLLSALPAGLSFDPATSVISGAPTTAGVTNVSLSANNAIGTSPVATLTITISAASSGGGGTGGGGTGGGGGGGVIIGGGGGGIPVTPPTISAQPASQQATVGSTVTLSVTANGTGLFFQWFKDGAAIDDARSSTLTLNNVGPSAAGSYFVYVSNSGGFVASSTVTVTIVTPSAAPIISAQPAAQSVAFGANAVFNVTATGTAPLTYQWFKDGTAIAGATAATLTLSNVSAAAAGAYSVVVTNGAGSATSSNAALSVAARAVAGAYFGTFGNNEGIFALFVRSDRTGVFLGYASSARAALISRNVVIDANGSFSVTQAAGANATALSTSTPPLAAAEGEYHIAGTISADGALTGTVAELNLAFSAPAASASGATAGAMGFYQLGAVGKSSTCYAILGAAGDATVVAIAGTSVDAGRGTVSANGALNITTVNNAAVTGTVQADTAMLSTIVTPATGAVTTFIGLNEDARTDVEKLINISTRSQTGTATNTLIAGFVISGDQKKTVLVRAVGPTLGSAFNVGGALSAARLELFRGSTSIAVGNDWGASANAAAIAATATRVGAFALPANSRDAALLIDLEPGAYSAVVTGQGGVSGVSLVEVYDATNGAIPRDQRIINIATRATAGTGDNSLIAGFVINGTVPKRVLIRGVGPALAPFGVTGVLARPQLTVNSGATVLAQNAGWSTSPDAAAIAAGSVQVGAFALGATSQDAALIVYLSPGAYTAQVSGVGNTTGVALIEVYELP